MKVLFITSHLHLPQLYGGLQNSTDQLCRQLVARGHEVALLSGLTRDDGFGRKARLRLHFNHFVKRHKITCDTVLGYPVWRTWFPFSEAAYVARKEAPDVIVVKSGDIVRTVSALKSTAIPVILQLHDVEFHMHNGNFRELGNIPCIANSRFTATKYKNAYGVDPYVMYPFISAELYRTVTTRENVTFINPHPQKGVDIALGVARLCPEIPFVFAESWPLETKDRESLLKALSSLPNVKLRPAVSDMRQVYGKCRILLAPSRWEEAYGRVASEAQFSGIPVIASNRGGLPEAVGTGGVLLNPEAPVEDWANAVRRLWNDKKYYAALSAEAYNYSSRPALDPHHQVRMFENICAETIQANAVQADSILPEKKVFSFGT